MQSTTSVSEGSFLFMPPGFSLAKIKKSKKRKVNDTAEELWHTSFRKVWHETEKDIKEINEELCSKVLEELVTHVKKLHVDITPSAGVLPCEVLLTGTNLPDHTQLLSTLCDKLHSLVTPHVSTIWSRDCLNINNAVKHVVQQIIPVYIPKAHDSDEEEDELEEIMEVLSPTKLKLQSDQFNLMTLAAWYKEEAALSKKQQSIVIIVPDFESCPASVLSEFLLLLSSYAAQLHLVVVLCVATTPVAVHQSLPRNVLSQTVIQLFRSDPSTAFLNQIVEKVFFSEKLPFRLGSKCMTFLMDMFLFHSFSVQGFIQGLKFCMMEHFYKNNHFALCCPVDDLDAQASLLTPEDVENIRKLPSFQKVVEECSKDDRKLLLLDDDHTKKTAVEMLRNLHEHTDNFHVALKCLHIMTCDLPHSPLGKHLREVYCKAVSNKIQALSDFKEAMKLLHLQSLTELSVKVKALIDLMKISTIMDILSLDKTTKLDDVVVNLEKFQKDFDAISSSEPTHMEVDSNQASDLDFEGLRKSLLVYMETEVVDKLLLPPMNLPLHEVLFFDDLPAVRRRLSGGPRGALHMALSNPHYYLECSCCKLPEPEAVLSTLPDISVAYKLHLECSKIINLYDWLQAFAATVSPSSEESKEGDVDPEVHARFTRAVSELQFLGFIKPSRSKTDHVTRLTWGNS